MLTHTSCGRAAPPPRAHELRRHRLDHRHGARRRGARAATHQTHVGPPLDEEDGAARVLDPVFTHVADPDGCRPHGKFFKDYHPAPW